MTSLRPAPAMATAGRVPFQAARASTLSALRRLLDAHGGPERCLLVDLSLGAWRGHEAARQLGDQLGFAPSLPHRGPNPGPDIEQPGTPPRGAEQISAGIDVEAAGDPVRRAATRLADQVMAALGERASETTVLVLVPRVLAPRPVAGWEDEDAAFVHSLATRLRRAGGLVLLVATDTSEPVLPGSWTATFPTLTDGDPTTTVTAPSSDSASSDSASSDSALGLVPGLLDPMLVLALRADATRLMSLPMLRGERLVIPPEWRPAAENTPPSGYDELAARACGVPWLCAYAQAHGDAASADPRLLCAQAWATFREGGGGVAIRLAGRAVELARGEREQAALRAWLDGMRIALFRYTEAAAAPDPSPELPPALRGFLLQTKGWGLAMAPDAPQAHPAQAHPAQAHPAEAYLAQARELLADPADEREYLYLLNISALARMKAGHPEEALGWEREIETRAAKLIPRDYQLLYVNAINQARLYRRLGAYHAAERYYHGAFATAEGVRSESDAVHANACLGRVAAEAGKVGEAYRCWLRAALHWLCAEVPEALAWRVVVAVVGRRPAPTEDLPDVVGGALADRLAALAARRGLGEVMQRSCPPPWFARYAGPGSGVALAWGAAGDGWSVFGVDPAAAASAATSPAGATQDTDAQDTPHQRRLRQLVHALLRAECHDGRLARSDTLYVHDNHGRELPADAASLVSASVLAGVRVLITPGGEATLSHDALAELRGRARARIGPAVNRIEPRGMGAVVHFRRYRSPLELTAEQFHLVTVASAGTSPTWSADGPAVDALTTARVLVVDLPEKTCTEVGARLLTNTSWTPS
ncbi:MAG: hypothetical protein ACRDRS_07145 [Pseudonocardiaceae bacterium]